MQIWLCQLLTGKWPSNLRLAFRFAGLWKVDGNSASWVPGLLRISSLIEFMDSPSPETRNLDRICLALSTAPRGCHVCVCVTTPVLCFAYSRCPEMLAGNVRFLLTFPLLPSPKPPFPLPFMLRSAHTY